MLDRREYVQGTSKLQTGLGSRSGLARVPRELLGNVIRFGHIFLLQAERNCTMIMVVYMRKENMHGCDASQLCVCLHGIDGIHCSSIGPMFMDC